jgi:hypothetical protein
MGQIIFEDEPPFELVTEKEPIAIADEGFVIVNLTVFAAGYPRSAADVQVRMTMEHAAALALQLAPALALAKEQAERLAWRSPH